MYALDWVSGHVPHLKVGLFSCLAFTLFVVFLNMKTFGSDQWGKSVKVQSSGLFLINWSHIDSVGHGLNIDDACVPCNMSYWYSPLTFPLKFYNASCDPSTLIEYDGQRKVFFAPKVKSNFGNVSCPRAVALASQSLPRTGLISWPGSGNTWMRHLIQQLTGESINTKQWFLTWGPQVMGGGFHGRINGNPRTNKLTGSIKKV